jgi:hypothetical protein
MNNPPAFPSGYDVPENPGMSLRDYFAAKAMQALLSDSDWRQDMDIKDTALAAYKTADAMMKERGREE